MSTYYQVAWQIIGKDEIHYGPPLSSKSTADAWVEYLNAKYVNEFHHWVHEYYDPQI